MFLYTARISKKKILLAILCLVALVVGAFFLFTSPKEELPAPLTLDTSENRISYLEDMGWIVASEPLETLEFILPDPLTTPYLTYNELQSAQGFDLSPYAGKQVIRYTYSVTNHPTRSSGVQLNLYIHEHQPIAGDIICPGADGFQSSLVYPDSADK